jgi:hypothetical protein
MFATHKCNEKGFAEITEFKTKIACAMKEIKGFLPEGRDKSLFVTYLETAMFWGTKAIASKDGNYTEKTEY